MNTKLFVGNLPYKLNEEDLKELFAKSGNVVSVAIPTDRDSGKKRGFAFVEMSTAAEAEKAIDSLHNHTIEGRQLVVNPSRPKTRSY